MNILIVSGFFYPLNVPRAFRTTELVKRFCKLGHKVKLYIPKDNCDRMGFVRKYPVEINYYNNPNSSFDKNEILFFNRLKNRILNQFFEYPNIKLLWELPKVLRSENGYDLLITIAAPHPIHWALGKIYSKGHRIAKTWIADCGDPYMFCGTSQYRHPFYLGIQEKRWCRECDFITVPIESAKDAYYPEFRNKIHIIPQAFDFDEVKLQKYVPNNIPTFAFSGNLIPKVRDPKPLLDYLIKQNMDFKFIVYTAKKHLVEPYKEFLGKKLEVYDYIPRLDLLYKLSAMDFLINIENSSQNQTPSKLIDYALTKRPILSINPLNFNTKMIDSFLNRDYTDQYLIQDIERYNIVNVTNEFLNLCNIK